MNADATITRDAPAAGLPHDDAAHDPPVAADAAPEAGHRLLSIDALRGLVMVLMALDHARDFLTNVDFEPTDLSKTNATLFLTRWVTHFCAPVFVFLAGVGARLSLGARKPPAALAKFLLTRGLWLVLLELTVVRFGWRFNLDYHRTAAQVIWALGWCMVLLAPFAFVRPRVAALSGAALVALHNLTDPIAPASFGPFAWLWTVLHVPGPLAITDSTRLFIAYPLIAWAGVMLLGYGFGGIFRLPTGRRRRALTWGGASTVALFVAVRLVDRYGDPAPWAPQPSALYTLFAFVNCRKYPPSLDYVLMTLGPALLALRALDGVRFRGPFVPLIVFGRVPLFYYLMHLPLLHLAAIALALVVRGHLFPSLFHGNFLGALPPAEGFGLAVVYAVWACAVAALYFLCARYARFKARSRAWWVSYL